MKRRKYAALSLLLGTAIFFVGCNNNNVVVNEPVEEANQTIQEESNNQKQEQLVAIDENSFPDEVFRQYISDRFDKDTDGVLNEMELRNVADIYITGIDNEEGSSYPGIKSLKGIELFWNLRSMTCTFEKISEIDLSNNLELDTLSIVGTNLTELDISNNAKLIENINNNTTKAFVDYCDFNPVSDEYRIPCVMYQKFNEEYNSYNSLLAYDYGVEIITGDYVLKPESEDNLIQ